MRGAAVEVAPVQWEQVGGYAKVKQRLQQAVEWPLQHAGETAGWLAGYVQCDCSSSLIYLLARPVLLTTFVCRILSWRLQQQQSNAQQRHLACCLNRCICHIVSCCAGVFKRLGLSPPRGVLLHGPPGCSKTMLARAAATGSKATFIPLSCAQVRALGVLN
jgi:hypothetical protein